MRFPSVVPWQAIAAAIIALQLVGVVALMDQAPHLPPLDSYLIVSAVFSVGIAYPTAWLYLVFRRKPMPWRWVLGVCGGFALVAVEWALIAWFKGMMAIVMGFTADEWLADLDALLFFGDPWQHTHAFLGWASGALDFAYITWSPVKIATLMALILLPRTPERNRLMIVYFLTVSLVTVLQFSAPSAGPVFYQALGLGDRFADMPLLPWVEATSSYLWQEYQRPEMDFGTGISAFPSMHVAIALWVAIVVRSQLPRLQILAWIFFAVVLVGSVHLGWHYALDGVASILLVGANVAIANRLTNLRFTPPVRARSAPTARS